MNRVVGGDMLPLEICKQWLASRQKHEPSLKSAPGAESPLGPTAGSKFVGPARGSSRSQTRRGGTSLSSAGTPRFLDGISSKQDMQEVKNEWQKKK